MKKTNTIIQYIINIEKRSLIKKVFQTLLIVGIIMCCFYLVDFFDRDRMCQMFSHLLGGIDTASVAQLDRATDF